MADIEGYLIDGPEWTVFVAGDVCKAYKLLDEMWLNDLVEDDEDYTITRVTADISLGFDKVELDETLQTMIMDMNGEIEG